LEPTIPELSDPYNWCDSRCERCVLARECPAHLMSERARRAEIAAGRDPDSLESICTQVEQQLSAAVEMLEAECRDRGIDPTMIHEWARHVPCEKLNERATEYMMAFVDLIDMLRGDPRAQAAMMLTPEDLDAISGHGYLIAGKLGRLASYLSDRGRLDDEVAVIDGAPNLLLIERLMSEVDERLQVQRLRRRAGAYVAAREAVRRLVQPLLAAIPTATHAQLARLVRLGRAPSPFYTRNTRS
jgi:hypothetical protein